MENEIFIPWDDVKDVRLIKIPYPHIEVMFTKELDDGEKLTFQAELTKVLPDGIEVYVY